MARKNVKSLLYLTTRRPLPPYDRLYLLWLYTTFLKYVRHTLVNIDRPAAIFDPLHDPWSKILPVLAYTKIPEYSPASRWMFDKKGVGRAIYDLVAFDVGFEKYLGGNPLMRAVVSMIRTLTVDLESGIFRLGADSAAGDIVAQFCCPIFQK